MDANFSDRIKTAVFVGPLIILCCIYLPLLFEIIFITIMMYALSEYSVACENVNSLRVLQFLLAIQSIFSAYGTQQQNLFIMFFVAFLVLAIFHIKETVDSKKFSMTNWHRFGVDFLGYIWLIWTAGCILTFLDSKEFEKPNGYLVYFLCMSWLADSTALYIGRNYGKTKFMAVSPKKTIEGIIASVVSGTFGYTFLSQFLPSFFPEIFSTLPLFHALWLGFFLAVFGIIGDLFESFFKRCFRLEDSGNLFPGHGGALDRVDSILFPAPFMVFALQLILQK